MMTAYTAVKSELMSITTNQTALTSRTGGQQSRLWCEQHLVKMMPAMT